MAHGCMVCTERARDCSSFTWYRGHVDIQTTLYKCTTSVTTEKRAVKSYSHSFRIICDKSAVEYAKSDQQQQLISELRGCVKVEVARPGLPSLISLRFLWT